MSRRTQTQTPFAAILQRAIDRIPGAIGGTLAAGDGETVDFHLVPGAGGEARLDETEWHILTAHHGVLLGHIRSALRTFHVGGPMTFVVSHRGMHVLLCVLDEDYFALLAVDGEVPVAPAMYHLGCAVDDLRREMHA
jgi:hypothetical protein